MSKHRTHGTIWRRLLCGLLSFALLLGLLPAGITPPVQAAHWADPYAQQLVEWGVMRGDVQGGLRLGDQITCAEFVAMMNRAYGYKKTGSHPFTDVTVRDWFYDDIGIGYNIGYFKGTSATTASPRSYMSRERAAVLLARNMMLKETVGETLGFSDSRTLSDWSRGLVGAAVQNGIVDGYSDGSFRPEKNITRGEVAAMLVKALGTLIKTPGDYALGNVYGNVTVNASGVKLRDGVIKGNLYLTGGIDVGDILLENVTVLGEIIASGGGESEAGKSSIVMRNVKADGMTVDSIGSQFVTIRAEGNTDIPTVTVRTNAYVDDSSLPGYGLWKVIQDGGSLLQLAGNIKEAVNMTPGSSMQVVDGSANKVTVDEKATGSTLLVDGDARVDELNLDTATTVTGTGDIDKLNVGAGGSTVEQLPDKIEIRPGITTDINGSTMNSDQAAESSADPKLLAGYPAVRKIAPTSANLVFKTNKSGTVYWAVSALADGSVSEQDLLDPPVYGGKILTSGTVKVDAANKEFTAAVSKLTSGGSYYVTAILVDGRDKHSPIKVTSFTTPDDTVPAFAKGYPVMSKVSCDQAQVTVMTTKSCLLYYALLPAGSTAPTANEFKANNIPGNLGYGSLSVTKNVTTPINVNSVRLDESTDYVLYLWLTDHDGAKSSKVVAVNFKTLDETPPIITSLAQTGATTDKSLNVSFEINEPADFVWAIVTEGNHDSKLFLNYNWTEKVDPVNEDLSVLDFGGDEAALQAAKIKLMSGTGALAHGSTNRSPVAIKNLPTSTSSFVVYCIANDKASATGNLSTEIKALRVHTMDNIKPTASLSFKNPDNSVVTQDPDAGAEVRIVFSENVKGGTVRGEEVFLKLYETMEKAHTDWIDAGGKTDGDAYNAYTTAKDAYVKALKAHIAFNVGAPAGTGGGNAAAEWSGSDDAQKTGSDQWVIDWNKVKVEAAKDGSGKVEFVFSGPDKDGSYANSALKLGGGAEYYFRLTGIYDLAVNPNPQPLVPQPPATEETAPCILPFATRFAKVELTAGDELSLKDGANDVRIDYDFLAKPVGTEQMDVNSQMCYDMLIWADASVKVTVYRRNVNPDGTKGNWEELVKELDIPVDSNNEGWAYKSVCRQWNNEQSPPITTPSFDEFMLKDFPHSEYAIHVNSLEGADEIDDAESWNKTVSVRVSIVAGTQGTLVNQIMNGSTQADYDKALKSGVRSVGVPDPFTMSKTFTDSQAPEIFDVPTIEIQDTGAKISMSLTKPGQVYYLVIPLSDLFDDKEKKPIPSSGTVYVEEEVASATKYRGGIDVLALTEPDNEDSEKNPPPLAVIPHMRGDSNYKTGKDDKEPLADEIGIVKPTRDDFISQRQFPGVFKGTTASVPANTRVDIDLIGKLEPNTVYLVCLLTRGGSAYSETVYGYRFTTKTPQRPILRLVGNSATSVDAIVDRTAKVRSVLLVESGLASDPRFKILEKDTKFIGYTNHKNDETTPCDFCSWAGSRSTTYTVRDALYDDYRAAPTAAENGCSVFDRFANDTAKNEIRQLIQSTVAGQVVKAFTPEQTVTVSGNNLTGSLNLAFPQKDLQPRVDYICLAYAESGTLGLANTAFRLTSPLRLMDDQAPELQFVSPDLYFEDGKVQGTITLIFNKDLYTDKRVPFAQSPEIGPVSNDEYYGLGGYVLTQIAEVVAADPLTGPISTITLKVTNAVMNRFTITVRGVCNSWGTEMDPTTVVVMYNQETKSFEYTINGKAPGK